MREWLKNIREEKGLTQDQFADFLGIPPTTYAMIEQGNRNPSVRRAMMMSKTLNCEWTLFFEKQVRDTSI